MLPLQCILLSRARGSHVLTHVTPSHILSLTCEGKERERERLQGRYDAVLRTDGWERESLLLPLLAVIVIVANAQHSPCAWASRRGCLSLW